MFRGSRNVAVAAAVAMLSVIAGVAQTPDDDSQPVKGRPAKGAKQTPVYIVQLIQAPVVAYEGGVPGLKATAPKKGRKIDPTDPDVVRYATYLDSRHDNVVAKVHGSKVYDYRYAFNGFAARLSPEQVAALKSDPEVLSVEKTQEVVMDTATTPAFLGLTDPTSGLWTMLTI
jgi:hypothetical protein